MNLGSKLNIIEFLKDLSLVVIFFLFGVMLLTCSIGSLFLNNDINIYVRILVSFFILILAILVFLLFLTMGTDIFNSLAKITIINDTVIVRQFKNKYIYKLTDVNKISFNWEQCNKFKNHDVVKLHCKKKTFTLRYLYYKNLDLIINALHCKNNGLIKSSFKKEDYENALHFESSEKSEFESYRHKPLWSNFSFISNVIIILLPTISLISISDEKWYIFIAYIILIMPLVLPSFITQFYYIAYSNKKLLIKNVFNPHYCKEFTYNNLYKIRIGTNNEIALIDKKFKYLKVHSEIMFKEDLYKILELADLHLVETDGWYMTKK